MSSKVDDPQSGGQVSTVKEQITSGPDRLCFRFRRGNRPLIARKSNGWLAHIADIDEGKRPRLRVFASRCWLVSLLLMCGLQGTAQQPATAPAPTPTLRAISRIVYVDVVVHDDQGKVVHGLKQEDFRLTENKTPQHIGLFEDHTHVETTAPVALAAPSRGSQPKPAEFSNTPEDAVGRPLNLVLFDLVDTAPIDQAFARKRMIAFLKAMPAGHQVALFVLSDRLHLIQGFTTDSGLLSQAAATIEPGAMNRLRSPGQVIADNDATAYEAFATRTGTWGAAPSGGHDLAGAIQAAMGQEDRQSMKARLEVVNRAFEEMARAVNGFPGRKNLFWLAGQFPSSTYFSLQNISSDRPTAGSFAASQKASGVALDVFTGRADRAVIDSQIAVYPVSVVGVQTDNVGAEYSGIGSALGADGSTRESFFHERQDNRSVMEHIATETGGEAFYGSNDAAAMLTRGFEDGENFYTLAYQPTDHNWDSRYRAISVALGARGYHLSYRRGYYALREQPLTDVMAQFASAMRIESPPSTMLTLRVREPVAEQQAMRFELTLDLHGVGFGLKEPDLRTARLQLLVIAYPVGGAGKPAQINNAMNLSLAPDDFATLMREGLPLRQTLHLQPGRYMVRVGVVDGASGRIGTVTLPWTMP